MILKNINPEEFEIKSLSSEHISSVAKLEELCFSMPISVNNLRSILINGIGNGFVCIETNSCRIAAYGGVIVAADEAQVLNIATHPDFRKRGLGKEIVKTIIDYSKGRGAEYITLEVRENNIAAISLYKSFGFCEVGRLKQYYKNPCEDALILKLELGSLE